MITKLKKVDILQLIKDYKKLENVIQWNTLVHHKGKQSSLQFKNGEDPWLSGVDRSKGDELSYNMLNEVFKDTYFESIINEFNLKRTRFMWLNGWCCYSLHKDNTPRIHIPIITNHQCFFIFKDHGAHHLPLGSVYWVDTREDHTFINGSDFPRLHLVGAIEN